MKNLFKNIIKTTFVVSFMFLGTIFVDAAGQFINYDPIGEKTITQVTDRLDAASPFDYRGESITVDIPNPGDSQIFRVYVAYQNIKYGKNIYDAKGKFDFQTTGEGSSTTIKGILTGRDNEFIQDDAVIYGLPSSWEIELYQANAVNNHTIANSPNCTGDGAPYNYEKDLSISDVISSGAAIDHLDYKGTNPSTLVTGVCDQGYFIGTFRVTNTESSPNPSSSLEVQTNSASSIGDTSARLNGSLVSGDNAEVWFVLDYSDYLLNCANLEQREYVSGTYNGGQNFSTLVSNLNPDTQYFYKACANDGSKVDYSSTIISFRTTGSYNTSTPRVDTDYVNDITDDSADIHGAVYMNDYNNGFVFYVYGEDESAVYDIESAYDSYSDINEDGDNLQKVEVDSDLDSSDNYSETLTNLDSDEDYYYNFCVEYIDDTNRSTLECGNVRSFTTDDNGSVNTDSEIETRNVDNITQTSAEICGDLVDDGGDTNLRTWMEYRKSTTVSYTRTDKVDRGEGYFCETVRDLSSDTRYYFRACSDDGCDTSSSFVTSDGYSNGDDPVVTTGIAYSIESNSAVLPGSYITNADRATVWFQYGYTPTYLNKDTRHYTKYGSGGSYVHYFTNLKSNQRYCYRAMIETENGSDHGSVNCFYTKQGSQVVIEVPDDTVDTNQLGIGLSLVRLEINNHREQVTKNENVTYEISWENISDLDLEDLDLVVSIPRKIEITSSSRGRLDKDRNAIIYNINKLDALEENYMTVTGRVIDGKLGDTLTADATISFNNPVNEARENAIDYDVDEYTLNIALGTASVFGLSNITFLGWLTILLGLLIVFLVARWLYLEKGDLRAQAYPVYGGRRPNYNSNNFDYENNMGGVHAKPQQQVDLARQQQNQTPQEKPISQNNTERPDYRPYRPNRG